MNLRRSWPLMRPWLLILPMAIAIGQVVSAFDRLKMVMLGVLPLLVIMVLNVELGVYAMLTFSTLLLFIKRMMPNLPSDQIGIVIEGMLFLMTMRMLFELFERHSWNFLRTPLTYPALVFAAYQGLEVFNPYAPSLIFGLSGLRDTMRMLGMGLILLFFRSKSQLKRFMVFWLGIILLDGLYGIFQHQHGLLNQEYLWLIRTGSYRTHILNGYIRVFGTLGDAATFGFLETTGILLLLGLAMAARGWRLLLLLLLALPMGYALVLSYSRGPLVALAAGIAFMLLASRNWKLSVGVVLLLSLGLGGLGAMDQHRLLDRMMTATQPTDDPSFNVRLGYVDKYWPRIVARPFGSGLWTAGASGLSLTNVRHLPGTTIGVPTDNNYFKYALEMGWVGVLLFLWLILSAIALSHRNYSRIQDPFLKALSLGLGGVLFAYFVGAFSNDIFVQKPLSEWLYLAMGLVVLLNQHREASP